MARTALDNLPLVQTYHPTTFAERGVAVPFTTPLLSGARARPGERNGLEVVIPSPAGGRGVYIMPWSSICELCRPTVHDMRLNQRIAALPGVTPASIRRAARAVAAEGLAGRDAMAAAGLASARDSEDVLRINFQLVLSLTRQVEPAMPRRLRQDQVGDDIHTVAIRAKRAFAYLAPSLGVTADAIAAALEGLAPALTGVGIAPSDKSPVRRAFDALRGLSSETLAWSLASPDDSGEQAAMIARVADLTIDCARATLEETGALTADMIELVRRWIARRSAVLNLVSRTEWLLDGWEQIALLWETAASDAMRRAVLAEMVLLVPIIPREASEWVSTAIDMDPLVRFRRTVKLNEDWRNGMAVFDLIERNERLRAMAA